METYQEFWAPKDNDLLKERIVTKDNWKDATAHHLPLILRPPIPTNGDVALEIGCGIGRLMKPMGEYYKHIIGLDFSPRMLEESKEYLPGADVRLIKDDWNFPVKDDSVDLVYSVIVFQHIPNMEIIRKYLAEAYRVLNPGGYLRIQTCKGKPAHPRFFQGFRGRLFRDIKEFQMVIKSARFNIENAQTGLGHGRWFWVTGKKQV